jgi:nicrotizing toxin Mtb-like protein
MRRSRRFGGVLAGFLLLVLVTAPVAAAAEPPPELRECSVQLLDGDRRLGPERLPSLGPVGMQLFGYDRTGGRPVEDFLGEFYDAGADTWRYPPAGGYVIGYGGEPIVWSETLDVGERIDRYGSEYGGFLAPQGIPYTMRSIPPSNLVGMPPEACNYHLYEVARAFDVDAGPIAPWFAQSGGGTQYQLDPSLVAGAPPSLSVLWLVDNGYLEQVPVS